MNSNRKRAAQRKKKGRDRASARALAGSAEPDLALTPGEQYAFVVGLLDSAYPFVTFVVELPFEIAEVLQSGPSVVVPMSSMRTGEQDDAEVKIRFQSVQQRHRDSSAPVDYLRSLPGRNGPSHAGLREAGRGRKEWRVPVTVVEMTTDNSLAHAGDAETSEIAVRLFNRCLDALDRLLSAYLVATEDHSVRPLTSEALGLYALVEFRDQGGEPLCFGGMLTLPRASPLPTGPSIDIEELRVRLDTSFSHEAVRHPMDVVVAWHVRAKHYSQVAGDYELALLALNISGEVLLDALWDTHQVDEGQDSGLYDKRPQFKKVLKEVTTDLGEPWNEQQASAWSNYVTDCYAVRNDVAHEGRRVRAEELDGAFHAYEAVREAVGRLTLATVQQYPRTAMLVHGPIGLQQAGALTGRVAAEHAAIQAEHVLAFWQPHDLRGAAGASASGSWPGVSSHH